MIKAELQIGNLAPCFNANSTVGLLSLGRGGPKKLDRKERINSDIKTNKISE